MKVEDPMKGEPDTNWGEAIINSEQLFAAMFLTFVTFFILKQINAWVDLDALPFLMRMGWISVGTIAFVLVLYHFYMFFRYNETHSDAWEYQEVKEKW